MLFLLTLLAALAAIAIMVGIALKVFREALISRSSEFGLGFLTGTTWDATNGVFGARDRSSTAPPSPALIALLIGGPFAIAIALFLSELAPRGVRGVVGTLVEMLAAIPSVVLGLWGILVMGPFVGPPHRALVAQRIWLDPALRGPSTGRATSSSRG